MGLNSADCHYPITCKHHGYSNLNVNSGEPIKTRKGVKKPNRVSTVSL